MAAAVVMLPVAGALSDRFGRKPILLLSAGAIIIFAWPLFNLLWHPMFHVPLLGQVGFALLIATFDGVAPVTAAEAFPANVRCTGVGLSHNLCMALLGGTAPMVATYLIDKTDNEMVPPMYLMPKNHPRKALRRLNDATISLQRLAAHDAHRFGCCL